ncbi:MULTISPECIES: hypothetical protein [Herbidospora]|uniref:hypothetical protein n=1 Tax=Herbidospora TaxID=28443 RepID=UPI000A9DB8E0|nr:MULTISPECIES: hypothetical protein [Herbidospora]
MRIRLEGSHAEITYVVIRLRQIFTVMSVTRPRPNRKRRGHYRSDLTLIPRKVR